MMILKVNYNSFLKNSVLQDLFSLIKQDSSFYVIFFGCCELGKEKCKLQLARDLELIEDRH